MKIAVLGTGVVGRNIAAKLVELHHDVMIGTRDVAKTLSHKDADEFGNPPFKVWHEQNPKVRLGIFTQAAAHGELVINATHGMSSLEALRLAGEQNLNSKILIDIANMLDFSKGMPPRSLANDEESLGEKIQRAFPKAKVVKTLNTVNAYLQVNPGKLANANHTVFMSGNDKEAKAQVAELLKSFGWKDIIDLGDITSARGQEMLMPIWLRLWGSLQKPMFNYKIVRE